MTNEEKAIISWTQEYRKHQFKDCFPTQEGFYVRGYVDGANEKDKQFKEYLEFQKIECLRTAKIVYAYDMSSAGELEIKAKCYDEIINELFGETEKDNLDREDNDE